MAHLDFNLHITSNESPEAISGMLQDQFQLQETSNWMIFKNPNGASSILVTVKNNRIDFTQQGWEDDADFKVIQTAMYDMVIFLLITKNIDGKLLFQNEMIYLVKEGEKISVSSEAKSLIEYLKEKHIEHSVQEFLTL